MLLFRSEEAVSSWSDRTEIPTGAIFDLDRLWALARSWYDDRLDRDWARRSPAERQALLTEAGLTGPFWTIDGAATPANP